MVEITWQWNLEALAAWAKHGKLQRELDTWISYLSPRGDAFGLPCEKSISLILESAGQHQDALARLLAASALLGGASEESWATLREALPALPLESWRKGHWRLANVPCVRKEQAILVTLLCGYSGEILPQCQTVRIKEESCKAIELASRLASQKWGGHFACWDWSEKTPMDGASLGLPIYLAFGCAAEGLPLPRALATGKLDEAGSVLPVEGVELKAKLAKDVSFFVPEANYSNPSLTCLQVSKLDKAFELWKCCGQGGSPGNLGELLLSIDVPERFFSRLGDCSQAELRFINQPDRVESLRKAFNELPSPCDALRSLLIKISASKTDAHRAVQGFLRILFPKKDLFFHAEKDPVIAWRLAMLHIRDLNHSGRPQEMVDLWKKAQEWLSALEVADSLPEEVASQALAVVGMLHNKFLFHEDPRQFLGPYIQKQIELLEKALDSGRKPGKPLGDWYGTLGQHHAFRGETVKALEYLEKAYSCFEGRDGDRRQNRNYLFFVEQDAGNFDSAREIILEYLRVDGLDARALSSLQASPDRPFGLFALARFAADRKDIIPTDLRSALNNLASEFLESGLVWGKKPQGHPWQLIFYNLGVLAEGNRKNLLWQKSRDLCLDEKAGPSIKVMALLPLAAMQDHGFELPEDPESLIEGIRETIRDHLSQTHFRTVLDAATWQDVLEEVSSNKKKLFPFNYR